MLAEINDKDDKIDALKQQLERLKELSKRHRDEEIANGRVIDVLNQELDELRSNSLNNHRNNFNQISPVIDNSKLVIELEQQLKRARVEIEELREANEGLCVNCVI